MQRRLNEIAVHEAGHLVVGYHLGCLPAARISLERGGDEPGEVHGASCDWSNPDQAWAEVVALLAGYRAAKRIAPLGRCLRGADDDLERVLRIMEHLDKGERVEKFFDARRRADELLDTHWDEVLGIAGLLLEDHTIDGEAAQAWCDYASGEAAAHDCAMYFALRSAAAGDLQPIDDAEAFCRERWDHYIDMGRRSSCDLRDESHARH